MTESPRTIRESEGPRPLGSPSVLYAISTLGGGTGAHLVRLLDRLDPDRWKAAVLCNGQVESVVPPHVPFFDERTGGGRFDRFPIAQWRQYRALGRTVRELRPTLLHTYFFWPIIYGRLLRRAGAIRYLVENREDQGFNWSPTDYRLLRLTAGLPDRVICVSGAVRDVVLEREGVSEDRTVVIPNGVSEPPPPPSEGVRDALRAELGLEPDHLVIGMVANPNREVKGVRYFIESIPLIAKQFEEARFLIVGEGGDRSAMMELARELGVGDRTVFTGFRTDVERLYSIMDVSSLTSLSEGLSITILESMSHALPVVATRVGGNPELIREGRTGLMVPPRDPESFAKAVIRLLENPRLRRTLGEAGLAVVRSEFTLDTVASRYQALYDEVSADDPTRRKARSGGIDR